MTSYYNGGEMTLPFRGSSRYNERYYQSTQLVSPRAYVRELHSSLKDMARHQQCYHHNHYLSELLRSLCPSFQGRCKTPVPSLGAGSRMIVGCERGHHGPQLIRSCAVPPTEVVYQPGVMQLQGERFDTIVSPLV